MGKSEISWKGRTEEGTKREVYAHHFGREWKFYVREKRYDQWEALADPPLDDWLQLLDGVERRIARRLLRPEEAAHVRKLISERFPGTEV